MPSIQCLTLSEALKGPVFDRIIIHSLDLCLYQASVVLGDQEFYLIDECRRHIRTHSVAAMQDMLEGIPAKSAVLRQQSAYDEMVGQPGRSGSNHLEVALSRPAKNPAQIIEKGSRTIQ